MFNALKDYGFSFIKKVGDDFKSLRGLWCWIYLGFYPCLIIYCVLKVPSCVNTAITVTGGLVGTIFSGYVISTSIEKNAATKATPADPAGKESQDDSTDLP